MKKLRDGEEKKDSREFRVLALCGKKKEKRKRIRGKSALNSVKTCDKNKIS